VKGIERPDNEVEQTDYRERNEERRQNARYELHGMAWFRWRSVDGNWHEGNGATRNICRCGAFIATKSVPPIASQLNVVVTIPATWTPEAEVRLSGCGDVRHLTNSEVEEYGYGAFVLFRTDAVGGTV
jgi:hypothetical protein